MPWDPTRGERLAPAWKAALTLLADGRWRPWREVADAMIEASDVLPVTCTNLLHQGVRHGVLQRRGQYDQRVKKDGRHLRLNGE